MQQVCTCRRECVTEFHLVLISVTGRKRLQHKWTRVAAWAPAPVGTHTEPEAVTKGVWRGTHNPRDSSKGGTEPPQETVFFPKVHCWKKVFIFSILDLRINAHLISWMHKPPVWGEFLYGSGRTVAQSRPTLCDPMNCSMPGLPVHHQLLEFTQTHVHRVSDAIQPSHPLSSPSPLAPNSSQHQSLFQWVNSLHDEVAKVLEFQL